MLESVINRMPPINMGMPSDMDLGLGGARFELRVESAVNLRVAHCSLMSYNDIRRLQD
jgi:hypothetical protein